MTPPRLTELLCPACHGVTWVIDSDDRGMEEDELPFGKRPYRCSRCPYSAHGWAVLRQSPPEFLLQPHRGGPMTQAAFDYWVGILREHFPDYPALAELGTKFWPYLPEEAEVERAAYDREYPVSEMKDQDGARRIDPGIKDVVDWADMMKPDDTLALRRRDGGVLKFTRDGASHTAVCLDPAGRIQGEVSGLQSQAVYELSRRYLSGDVAGCVRRLGGARS